MTAAASRVGRDFANRRLVSFLLWGAPALVMVGTAFVSIGDVPRGVVWAACLSVFGVGCVANALRCGRRYCCVTGPFFLIMALASLLVGFGVLSLAWGWLGLTTLLGAVVLTYVPDRTWGKYIGGERPGVEGGCGQ